ncbi:MAG: MFS transporter [Bacteroidota bacterium]|jgi:PAT family beta-lactamase induction signal transducer AmpG|nr:AmpG family muropeptide MFS transporter [Ignavibacteria bacterium]HEX2961633.1 MFS transporter [Ignavibacteriales bacterium]MCU7497944.1 AmpG family muropeptide MFS transporter [Ignavibacteria bacterium]MCU7514380.1 AmpG family muropeptide MFS transporter [Ignavibacteria bacterium]MCU7519844.1 AmpG family muropeptide MFS transporter [Ignavibacteria bacterium]
MSKEKTDLAVENEAPAASSSAKNGKSGFRNPWAWVPSLYYAEGIPYAIVMLVSVIMYKDMGISNTDITFYTAWLNLPWVIKPLWSPFLDMFRKKRSWIISMQFLIGVGLAGVALTIPASAFFQYTIMFFFLLAFSSATHDIAADGFYMLGLDKHNQALYAGIRSTFYRIAMITAQGILVVIAGTLSKTMGVAGAWTIVFYIVTALFGLFAVYHFFMLPRPASDKPAVVDGSGSVMKNFVKTFALFFQKNKIVLILAFLLTYRLGEALLLSLVAPFLKDPRALGGLGLTTEQIGIVSGTVGVAGLLCGGIIGGIFSARVGLGKALWWMFAAINLPAWVYVMLSFTQPESIYAICVAVGFEQFCYGFGFTAYMLFMMYVCQGELKTSHYSIATGFMALSMMIPRMFAGKIEDMLGYQTFFIIAALAVVPAFLITRMLPYDPDFGKKTAEDAK